MKSTRYCLNCGKPITKPVNKYCDAKCCNEHKHKQFVDKAESTGEFNTCFNNEANRKFVRRYLLEKYGHKCSICGITEWLGKPVPLVVDHIDGDPYNRKIDNFRLVCGNCDMQLPTYKSKNRGRGRQGRKAYYKN